MEEHGFELAFMIYGIAVCQCSDQHDRSHICHVLGQRNSLANRYRSIAPDPPRSYLAKRPNAVGTVSLRIWLPRSKSINTGTDAPRRGSFQFISRDGWESGEAAANDGGVRVSYAKNTLASSRRYTCYYETCVIAVFVEGKI